MADPALTHFELLGLPRRFALDPREVEANYLRRSREVHPDFHQSGAASVQRASMEMSAALNEAYATLRDPFRRAECLMALEGGPSAAEYREMTPGFLMEMLELREQIEELRGRGPTASTGLDRLEGELQERREKLVGDIATRFSACEGLPAGDSRRDEKLRQVRELLNTARYIQGLLRDLRAD
jgi:molecular chaperone HscB